MKPKSLQTTNKASTKKVSKDRSRLKLIPKINSFFKIISIALVFVLDIVILISEPALWPFWVEMLVVFVLLLIFINYEYNFVRKKASSSSPFLDSVFVALVIVRNLVLFLNFIPFIQIIGAIATIFGIVPYLIIYSALIYIRKKIS